MTWPTPYVPRDPEHVITARREALIADHRDHLREAAARRARARAAAARAAEANRARGAAGRANLVEDIEWLTTMETPREILMHLGTTAPALSRRLYRAERPDLARPFERIAAAQKRAQRRERRAA